MHALGERGFLLAGFLAGFLAVGIPYWVIPYKSLNLPDALFDFGIFVVGLAALALRAWTIASFWKTTVVVGASAPAAVLGRVFVEGMVDPTSHNLWPFEVVIALGIGFAAALTGAVIGSLVARLRASGAQDRP
jgi:hypothetical protein